MGCVQPENGLLGSKQGWHVEVMKYDAFTSGEGGCIPAHLHKASNWSRQVQIGNFIIVECAKWSS